jgi:hypothetical protein
MNQTTRYKGMGQRHVRGVAALCDENTADPGGYCCAGRMYATGHRDILRSTPQNLREPRSVSRVLFNRNYGEGVYYGLRARERRR